MVKVKQGYTLHFTLFCSSLSYIRVYHGLRGEVIDRVRERTGAVRDEMLVV